MFYATMDRSEQRPIMVLGGAGLLKRVVAAANVARRLMVFSVA